MKSQLKFLNIIALVLICISSRSLLAQNYSIPRSVIGNGGGSTYSSSFSIVGTIGHSFVGTTSNSSYIHMAGFWIIQRFLVSSVEENTILGQENSDFLMQNYPNPLETSTTIQFPFLRLCARL